jgi:hypothetical protein
MVQGDLLLSSRIESHKGNQKVYYVDVNLETRLPNLVNKPFIDNIQGRSWTKLGQR